MLKFIVGGLLLIFFGAIAMSLLVNVPTYVLVSVGNTDIEFSLWAGIVVLSLVFVLLYLLFNLLRTVLVSFSLIKESRAKTVERRTQRGLLHFIEGNWNLAKKELLSAAKYTDQPLLQYLAAAQSAMAMGAADESRFLLEQARASASANHLVLTHSAARLYLAEKNFPQALEVLRPLAKSSHKSPVTLDLLKDTYSGLHDWESVITLLPHLKKSHLYTQTKFDELSLNAYLAYIEATATAPSANRESLDKAWHHVPKELKLRVPLLGLYATQLHKLGEDRRAEEVILIGLKHEWHGNLAELYGSLNLEPADKPLKTAESWLKDHPDDAHLHYALGKLSMKNSLWGKARDYFERSLTLQPRADVYAALGLLLAQLGEREKSASVFKQGLLSQIK